MRQEQFLFLKSIREANLLERVERLEKALEELKKRKKPGRPRKVQ